MRYVAIILRASTFAERGSRPRYSLLPLNPDSANNMLEAARGRHDIAEPHARDINEGDTFMRFDGGRVGVDGNLLSYANALKSKVRRTMYLMKDPLVEARMELLKRPCHFQLIGAFSVAQASAPGT